jgi:radical SAM protein with 4Fe4S-binding SPASM domain
VEPVFIKNALPYRRVEDLSLIHLGERRIFFNESGTAIWELLDGRRTNQDVAHALASKRGSPAAFPRIAGSIDQFVNTLQKVGLGRREPDGQEPVSASPDGPPEARHDPSPRTDDGCVTIRKAKSETPLSAESGAETPASIEARFNDLCWSKYYIQKMHVELTYRCNFRCIQCYNTTHAGTETELSRDEWVSALEQLANMGCHSLTFTGGEVFVRKDVIEIFQAACDNGFSFRINTNGSLITEAIVEKLEPMRPFLQSFDISFYGASPQVHDTLARRLGSYQATLRAVKLLKARNWRMLTKFVTMKDNFEGVKQWQAHMEELGVPHTVSTGPLIPRTDRNTSPLVQILTDEQFKTFMQIQPDWESSQAHSCRPGHIRGCITPDGHISPCEWLTDFKLGNLKRNTLREIWYSEECQAFRSIFDEQESECPPCELRPGCSRCPARSYLETGNLQQCAPTARHFADLYMRAGLAR